MTKSNLEAIRTADGSYTLFDTRLNEHYHSTYGALGESQHIYIEMGLKPCLAQQKQIRLLEVGMGTGLNLLLTLQEARHQPDCFIEYHTLEPYPISPEVAHCLQFPTLFEDQVLQRFFVEIHQNWIVRQFLPNCLVYKHLIKLEDFTAQQPFDLVYFSAFAPKKQPDLWTPSVFSHLYTLMSPNTNFVTYSSQGQARRNMKEAGFEVRKQAGAMGKHQMVVGTRPV